MIIYKVYYYAEGEEVELGCFLDKEKAIKMQEKWKYLTTFVDEIEVEE